jgi:hypothetical protein
VVNSTGAGLLYAIRANDGLARNNTVRNASVAVRSERDSTGTRIVDLRTDGPVVTATGRNYELQPTSAPAPAPAGLESVDAVVRITEPADAGRDPPVVNLSIAYDQTAASGIDETSLAVYRYTGTEWVALASTADPATNRVNASLVASQFGTLGVFGVAGVTPTGDVAVTPGSLSFGDVEVSTTTTRTLTVANTGTADLTVRETTISGPNAADFTVVSGGAPFVLAAGTSRDVTVRLAPTAATAREATLTVASDDPDEPTVDVSLSGTGTLPAGTVQVSLVPVSGTVAPGGTVAVDVVRLLAEL